MINLYKIEKHLSAAGIYLIEFFVLGFIVDLFILKEQYDFVTFPLLILWILIVYIYRLSIRKSLYTGIIMLIITPLFQSLGLIFIAEKAATWAYIMIFISATQMSIDFMKS